MPFVLWPHSVLPWHDAGLCRCPSILSSPLSRFVTCLQCLHPFDGDNLIVIVNSVFKLIDIKEVNVLAHQLFTKLG